MSGTSPTATFGQTNFTTQTPTVYKTQIDSNSIVMQRIVDCFAPRQSNTPAMTVTLDPGYIFRGTTLTEVAAQTTGTIAAPTGNPRIDRVVVDKLTGAISVVTGTPAASPTAPAIPTGKAPVCQVLLQTTSTTITNSMFTDERVIQALGRGAIAEEGFGAWMKDDGTGNLTLKVSGPLKDDGAGNLTGSLTTEATITAAATTNLGTMISNIGVITGNTGISSFGNSASVANPFYIMRIAGTPLLTNSANMILPGGANYQCAAGDILFCKFEGSSKWRVGILTASGQPVIPALSTGQFLRRTIYTSGSGTWAKGANTNTIKVEMWGAGGGYSNGTNGGNSTFDAMTAGGGQKSTNNSGYGGNGGTASGGDINISGGNGGGTNASGIGQWGGASPKGGAGGVYAATTAAAAGNTPGGGCGCYSSDYAAGGGAYCEKIYSAPSSASYSVGTGGTGTYTGGDGMIIVEEYS